MNDYPIKLFKVQRNVKFDPTKDFVVAKNAAEEASFRQQGFTDISTAMTIATQGNFYAWFDRYSGWLIVVAALCILYGIWLLIGLDG